MKLSKNIQSGWTKMNDEFLIWSIDFLMFKLKVQRRTILGWSLLSKSWRSTPIINRNFGGLPWGHIPIFSPIGPFLVLRIRLAGLWFPIFFIIATTLWTKCYFRRFFNRFSAGIFKRLSKIRANYSRKEACIF